VLIGCDGSNSVVAKFLGLKPATFLPLWAARGLTTIPGGHGFRNRFLHLIGKDINFRIVPIDDETIYFSDLQSRHPQGTISIKARQTVDFRASLIHRIEKPIEIETA
jgi:2-polyprenyl-6-methoxyphenol hydroxylase-like FAD-dependent oxidoreductase